MRKLPRNLFIHFLARLGFLLEGRGPGLDMASALSPPKGPKPKGMPPSHYYESFLEKKGPCDQVWRVGSQPASAELSRESTQPD